MSKFLWRFTYSITRYTIIYNVKKFLIDKIQGIENFKNINPPFLVISNHISQIDPLLIIGVLFDRYNKQKIHFITNKGSCSKFFERFIAGRWAGCILIDFNKLSQSRRDILSKADKIIKEKKGIVAIFPEGERVPDGDNLLMGKTGAVRLTLQNKIPILLIGIYTKGEKHVIIKGRKRSRIQELIKFYIQNRGKIYNKIIIGKPINIYNFWESNCNITYTNLRMLTSRVMKVFSILSNKHYTHYCPDYILPNPINNDL